MTLIVEQLPGWRNGVKLLKRFPREFGSAVKVAISQEAHWFRKKFVASINSNISPKHSTLTKIIRKAQGRGGRSKTLIDRGDLRASIVVVPAGSGGVFVGVKRGRQSRGKDVVNVAKIMENGANFTQRMTDRQRRFIFHMVKKAGKLGQQPDTDGSKVIKIHIPARRFMSRVINLHAGDIAVRKRLRHRVSKLMRGMIGTAPKPSDV